MTDVQAGQRLDRWLWFARIVKSRTLASRLVEGGKVRINRERVREASRPVRPGDVVTAAVHGQVRVLRIRDCGTRRGPASEAAGLYDDLTPASAATTRRSVRPAPSGLREPGSGRPTKRERRVLERFLQGI